MDVAAESSLGGSSRFAYSESPPPVRGGGGGGCEDILFKGGLYGLVGCGGYVTSHVGKTKRDEVGL